MPDSIVPAQREQPLPKTASFRDRLARRMVLARLAHLEWGRLTLVEPDGEQSFGRPDPSQPDVTLTVASPRFFSSIAFRGGLGAAEAYMDGAWSCDDLPGLIRMMVRNESVLQQVDRGWARLAVPAARVLHWLRRNTRAGSRSNIAAHYDLGNDFYALFLDETMTYSSGIFEHDDATLAEASAAKYDRICRKLSLNPADRVVEIGCGWGGFALHAAAHYGCHVTGVTISQEQLAFARRRVAEAGLADRVDLRMQDYRDVRGKFDKLVSIEMIEAVGHQYLGAFLRTCSDLLTPGGQMALQAITIADQRYARHIRTVDVIKRYIFPGGCLVSVTAVCGAATRATDLRLVHMEDITSSYARTLREWRARFLAAADSVREMGFPESFLRLWEYYLAYCEGAFTERYVGDVQMILAKPLCRLDVPLGTHGD